MNTEKHKRNLRTLTNNILDAFIERDLIGETEIYDYGDMFNIIYSRLTDELSLNERIAFYTKS